MEISKAPSRQTTQGSPDWFIGSVQVEQLFPPRPPARTSAGKVTFEPGSRNSWHTHPLGQTLIITYGTGWVQEEGKPTQEVTTGDIVWFPPGVKHWHGATPTTSMTHIAIQEAVDGKVVEWLERVSDAQYRR